jgi:sugar phosphate permease
MGAQEPGTEGPTDAQRLAYERGIQPDMRLVRRARPRMRFGAAVGYVLAVRTNIALIVASACGYYFLAGVETFGVEFVKGQYGISQVLSGLLLLVVGAGAIIGILVGGRAGDFLLHRGHLSGRVTVSAVTATATVVLFIPALLTHNVLMALPYVMFAAAALEAQNPPISAARLDIMPSWLWGRAEGVRTFLRRGCEAAAPTVFGFISASVFAGPSGLTYTFLLFLITLLVAGLLGLRALRTYPRDVATASASTQGERDG